MGKRSTKVKKPTEEFPPLRGVIEKGTIRPAFAYDAERLDSFHGKANVLVWISFDGDRPLIRKWWAILGWYLKNTTLPWSDKETASAAIKLALTMIEPFQLPSGQWAQYPQTLTKFDDAELEGKIREMQQLLYDITGVDQETMRREGGSLGDEPFETTQPANDAGEEILAGDAVPPPASEESASAGPNDPPPAGTGATDLPEAATERLDDLGSVQDGLKMSTDGQPNAGLSTACIESPIEAGLTGGESAASTSEPASGGPAPVDETEAREEPSASSAGELSTEERVWLKQGGKLMLACLPSTDPESLRVLVVQLRLIRDLAPKDVTNACLSRMEVIRLHVTGVCKGQHKIDVPLVAKTAMCSVSDVTPDPVKVRQ